MCGIVGFVNLDGQPADQRLLRSLGQPLRHRGPDGEAEIKFVSSSSEVQMRVRCVGGVPSAETEVDDESGDDD